MDPQGAGRPWFLPVALTFVLSQSGCQLAHYEEAPLDQEAILEEVSSRRRGFEERVGEPIFPLAEAEALVLERDPELRRALAALRAAAALDEVKTPLQDPSLRVGVNGAMGSAVTQQRVAPVISAGVPVPISSRRRRQDERDLAAIALAEARVQRAARAAVLRIRRLYLDAAMAREVHGALMEIESAARSTADAAGRLTQAGTVTALDLRLLQLEATRAAYGTLDAQLEFEERVADLALALGLTPGTFDDKGLEELGGLDGSSIAAEPLLFGPMEERQDLALLVAEYRLTEAQLALQVARQVQDITLGGSLGPELAEAFTVLGLGVAGALPIFNRNAQGIASAFAARTEAEERYRISLDQAQAQLESALSSVTRAERRYRFLRENVQAQAEAVATAATGAVSAGTADAVALLSAQRAQREADLSVLRGRQSVLGAWLEVEAATHDAILPMGDPSMWLRWQVSREDPPGPAEGTPK